MTGGPGERLTIARLDALPDAEARTLLASCCGSRAWVGDMLSRRPFGSTDALLTAAAEIWWSLAPDDRREAFDHHPRIGERDAAIGQGERAEAWSREEQGELHVAKDGVRSELARANREYEERFGHIYLVSASGKSAEELLATLRARLSNDPAAELLVAAGEQAKITAIRLDRLVNGADERSEGK